MPKASQFTIQTHGQPNWAFNLLLFGLLFQYGSTDTGDFFEDGDENKNGLGDQGTTKKEVPPSSLICIERQ